MKQSAKEDLILKELKKLIPGLALHAMRSGNEAIVNQAYYAASSFNKDWQQSQYAYKGETAFVHFTSLTATENIIRNRNVRLYNLNHLNDPREYSYAGNLLTVDAERRSDARENNFILSMCECTILTGDTAAEFNLWRLYGQEGKGIAVELHVDVNRVKGWRDYFLSKIFYGDEGRSHLQSLHDFINKYAQMMPAIEIDLASIACFHKSRLFKLEQEVRLLFDKRLLKGFGTAEYSNNNKNIIAPLVRTDIERSINRENIIQYLELPVYHKGFVPVTTTDDIPVPKINKLIVGYHYNKNFKQVKRFLEQHCKEWLGYVPTIEQSRLTKYYHDYSGSLKT